MPVIEVNGLTKAFRTYKKQPGFAGAVKGLFHRQYEQTVAVNDVSFQIEPGELVGFLGPNGAGKTTTLKMLAGLLYPDERLGQGPRLHAVGTRRRLPPPVRARARPEKPALVGLARARIAGAERENLRHSRRPLRAHRRRNERTAHRQGQAQRQRARTFPRRTHENGTDRLAAAPAQGACSSTNRPSAST